MSWCGERFRNLSGGAETRRAALHRNERDEWSAKQNAAVCRAQDFSPKQCQETRGQKVITILTNRRNIHFATGLFNGVSDALSCSVSRHHKFLVEFGRRLATFGGIVPKF